MRKIYVRKENRDNVWRSHVRVKVESRSTSRLISTIYILPLLFCINFGDHNLPYPVLGSNILSTSRRGQRFHFLQCRGSLPSLCFVNPRVRWAAFTKTYWRGKWLISHLPPTFAIIIHIPRPLRPCIWRPRVPVPHAPASHTWCPQVPRLAPPSHKSPHTRPDVPVPLLYTARVRVAGWYLKKS